MNQVQRLEFLIQALLCERPQLKNMPIPPSEESKKRLLRSLLNTRPPMAAGGQFLKVQNEYLRQETRAKGITDANNLLPIAGNLFLWQGDITCLKVDAIVNAANNQMLGCFAPCHGCIDNAIHTFAGVQLRLACDVLMKKQAGLEPTGNAKITPAYNLPSRYVLHTVGPIIGESLTENDCQLLARCYRSCLALAEQNGLQSIGLCCISTGEFRFPNEKAANIAVASVKRFIAEKQSKIKVIFNVFKDIDYDIYKQLLTAN